ncbi:MAG: hypothetical protein K9L82_17015 [Chromatiaceae bacterium]|nr:hypothetical protein [Chromatiaceae bacterium]MCF7993854.1 hypothetical protein [Chromatiaceae bacterium]MCF8003874.1 hypothetical protein [Chromatiaceae bacterium]MCF8017147.1 hypothetical protein [Chromatiaceae bacterium]
MLVWHYTTGEKFLRIVEDGALMPSTIAVQPPEKPILWFSMAQDWEITASKFYLDEQGQRHKGNRETTRAQGRGLVRFGINPDRLHPWPKIARKARMDQRLVQGLERAATKDGANPRDWLGTTKAILLDQIARIEVEENGAWVTVKTDQEAAA